MIIWYNNSLFASVISVLGCAGIIGAISELMKDEYIRELSVQEAACVIAAGILMVILGKIISVSKAKKTQAKEAQATASGSNAGGGQSRQTEAYAVQGTYAQPAVGSAITGKSLNVPIVMAGIFFLLVPVMGIWADCLYVKEAHLSMRDFLNIWIVAEYIMYVLLIIASFRGKQTQEISLLYVIGFLGLAAVNAEYALLKYRIYGNQIITDTGIYYVLYMVPLFRSAADLLMALFALFSMKKVRKRLGGLVRWLWLLPFPLLLLADVKSIGDKNVFQMIQELIKSNASWSLRHEYLTAFWEVCLTLAIFFTGFCFQRVCRRKPAVYSAAPFVQPAQAQPEPPCAAPAPPVQELRQKQGNTAAGQTVNQDLEKKIQAYQDLLACGILSQEEYDQAIRELTRK